MRGVRNMNKPQKLLEVVGVVVEHNLLRLIALCRTFQCARY